MQAQLAVISVEGSRIHCDLCVSWIQMDCFNVWHINEFLHISELNQVFGTLISIQFHLVQFSSVQFSSVQFSVVQFSSVQFSSVHCSSVQFSLVQCNSVQFSAVQFSSVQFSSVQFCSVQFNSILFYFIPRRAIEHLHGT